MTRYTATVVSSAAIVSGTPATTVANGWFASLTAGASQDFRLRRLTLGVIAGATVPTSQQVELGIHRQSTRATGTVTSAAGAVWNPRAGASAITGLDTAFTTSAPVVGATPMYRITFNTQSGYDLPAELLEEWICDQGTANGLALVNWSNTLPASHSYTASLEWEE